MAWLEGWAADDARQSVQVIAGSSGIVDQLGGHGNEVLHLPEFHSQNLSRIAIVGIYFLVGRDRSSGVVLRALGDHHQLLGGHDHACLAFRSVR